MTPTATSIQISDAQVRQYWDDGFIIVPRLLTEEHMDQLRSRATEFAHGKIPTGSEKMVVLDVRVAKGLYKPDDPEKGMWKYLHPDRYDPLFRAYAETPALLDVIERLIGPDLKAFLTMFIYKPPKLDETVHPYHQDGYYFPFGPHDKILGTWVPLDFVDRENGTMSVIRGSHKWGLKPHEAPRDNANAGLFGVFGVEGHADEVTLEMGPGDGVFFHSRLLHTTGSNVSDRHRRVMTVHYASAECRYEPDAQNRNFMFRLVRGRNHEGCI